MHPRRHPGCGRHRGGRAGGARGGRDRGEVVHLSGAPGTLPPINAGAIETFGDVALRFEVEGAGAAAAYADALRACEVPGLREAVGGAGSVLVVFDPDVTPPEELRALVSRLSVPASPRRGSTVTIDVCFDGPDLAEVGELTGLGAAGVARALQETPLRVSFLGFAPGFAYLSGLPETLRAVPRRPDPRPAVPAGSLAIGGGHAAIYPSTSPGGWQLLGRTGAALFDPRRRPPALLAPGDVVRLRAVPTDRVTPPVPAPGAGPGPGRPVFTVSATGLYTAWQDRGRPGFAHLGVPASGAADPVSFLLANRLLGNPDGAPCLEVTGAGPTLRCRERTFVALVGGSPEVTVDGRSVGAGRVVPVLPGQVLRVGSTGSAMRSYLSVRGGFAAPAVLGSSATDRLSGLGPRPLAVGDELAARPATGSMADHLIPTLEATGAGRRRLRVLTTGGLGALPPEVGETLFAVDETSDRVGLRLRPPEGSGPGPGGDVASAGMVLGAVQLPPAGWPVVLGPDHATHGGYRVPAVVISADAAEIGRCRPGDPVELVVVDEGEALAARRRLARMLRDAVVGTYPVQTG